jgi:hypothetical protein
MWMHPFRVFVAISFSSPFLAVSSKIDAIGIVPLVVVLFVTFVRFVVVWR